MPETKFLSDFAYDLAQWLKNGQKVFFLMGAGCSYYNGIPLMNGFLDTAAIDFPGEWGELSKFLTKVRKASDTIHTNFYNIEELMTLIETYKIFDEAEAESKPTEDACLSLIRETINKQRELNSNKLLINGLTFAGDSNSHEIYFPSLSHWLLGQLCKKYSEESNKQIFIATFNYDDLLLKSLLPTRTDINGQIFDPTSYKNQPGTEYPLRRIVFGPISLNEISSRTPLVDNYKVFQQRSWSIAHLHGSIQDGNIIPPTQNKIFSDDKVKKAWQKSKEFLQAADHLVVCGYSMPITDTFFSHFLTLARMDSDKPLRITVINPDPTGEVQARFENVLSKGITKTGRWKFINGDNGKFENLFCNLSESIENPFTGLDEVEGIIKLQANSRMLYQFSKKFEV